jgi:serine protease AprX
MNTRRGCILSVCLILGSSSAAIAGTHTPELEKLNSNKIVDVIVTFVENHDGAALTSGQKLIDLPGGEVRRITAAEAIRMAKEPGVAHVSINHTIHGAATPAYDFMPQAIQPVTKPTFGLQVINQGQGVPVAVIDSGINASSLDLQNFGATVVYAQSFVTAANGFTVANGFSGPEDASDYYGHGTHVAGIIAGTGLSSLWGYTHDIFGVAPGVALYNLKVLDKNGESSDATVIQAIDAAIALKVKVINLSLGRPIYESFLLDPLCQEVETAWLKGITVVIAAGNEGRVSALSTPTGGYATIASPGNDPLALTVGAVNTESSGDRTKAMMTTYSSKGPSLVDHVVKPDLVAPGNDIYSIKAMGSYLALNTPYTDTGSYLILSGTSMSAAVTSGSVATLLASEPGLTNNQIKARLMKTAKSPNTLLNNGPYVVAGYTLQSPTEAMTCPPICMRHLRRRF